MTKNGLKLPSVVFSDDYNDRLNHLLFVAFFVANRFYQNHGFIVLPHKRYKTTKTVLLPDIIYPENFWKLLLRSGGKNVGQNFPAAIKSSLQINMPPLAQNKRLEKFWRSHQQKFWKVINKSQSFNHEIMNLEIKVILTEYGPGAAFCFIKKHHKTKLTIAFRVDRKPKDLFKSIISGLVLIKNGRPRGSDEKFWKNYFLSEFFHKEIGYSDINIPPSKLEISTSKKFLEKLGFGLKRSLKIRGDYIFLKERNLSRHLSPQENNLLKEFVSHHGEILSHDQIANILWGEDALEKYSLWAQSKLIEKLRKKLQKNGLDRNILTAVYRKGYLFD